MANSLEACESAPPGCGPADYQRYNCLTGRRDEAEAVSRETGVATALIVAWSLAEAGWGADRRQQQLQGINQNYFGTRPPTPNMIPCPPGAAVGFACYASFENSARDALLAPHNNWVDPTTGASRGITPASVITNFIQANPGASAAAVFQAVADAGHDRNNSTYGIIAQNTLVTVRRVVGTCGH